MYYLAMDGGGTKLIGLLFDEQYRLVASARTEGTHASVYSAESIEAHIRACYETLFTGLSRPIRIERLYTVCGKDALFASLLPNGVILGSSRDIGEPVSALYAGAGQQTGFVALSGTGSDVFAIRDSQMIDLVGGFGAILGDEGSGVWMARHAMQAAIRFEQGWGEATAFGEIVQQNFGFSRMWDYVKYLYASPAPFRRLGELLPLMAKAAEQGDRPMQSIFAQGGILMAKQMIALMNRNPDMQPCITACGGAWKAHPLMAEAFAASIAKTHPAATFTLPRFEHIMAGPICLAMERDEADEAHLDLLAENFPQFIWNA